LDLLDQLVLKEYKGRLDQQDLLVLKEYKAFKAQRDLKANKERKAILDQQAFKAILDPLVPQVQQEQILMLPVLLDQQALRVFREIKEIQEM
jgi:hypothetical protein